jgi:hypothetical protein
MSSPSIPRLPSPSPTPSLTGTHVKKKQECPNFHCAMRVSHDFIHLPPLPTHPPHIQKITITRFLTDANPFPNLNRWEVTDRTPHTPLTNGQMVFVEIFGVLTLRTIESGDSRWVVFRCTDKDNEVQLEVVARKEWCKRRQGWFPLSFLC